MRKRERRKERNKGTRRIDKVGNAGGEFLHCLLFVFSSCEWNFLCFFFLLLWISSVVSSQVVVVEWSHG
jgi:hypothetical protein